MYAGVLYLEKKNRPTPLTHYIIRESLRVEASHFPPPHLAAHSYLFIYLYYLSLLCIYLLVLFGRRTDQWKAKDMEEVSLMHSGIEELHVLVNKTHGGPVDRKEAGTSNTTLRLLRSSSSSSSPTRHISLHMWRLLADTLP